MERSGETNIEELLCDPGKRLGEDNRGKIVHFQNEYSYFDKDMKDLLRPLHFEDHLRIIKKIRGPEFKVLCIGSKKETTKKFGIKDTLKNSDADLIVCMVELVKERNHTKVKSKSLELLRHCFDLRRSDTEILIESDEGIHASRAKYIVFEKLHEMGIYRQKTVYHRAETNVEDIALYRVISATQHIQDVAKSLRNCFPDNYDIRSITLETFENHLTKENVTETANNIDLWDNEKLIGTAYDASVIYHNGYKVRELRKQLVEKCTKKVADQISKTLKKQLQDHISTSLNINTTHSLVSLDETRTREKISSILTHQFDFPATSILLFILGMLQAIFDVPFLMLYVLFNPVDVNSSAWRYSCVHGCIDKFWANKEKFISDITEFAQRHYEPVSNKLKPFTREIYLPSFLEYNEAMFKEHKELKHLCFQIMDGNEKLIQNVKKIIIGKFKETLEANIYLKKGAEPINVRHSLINLQHIGQSTYEDKNIHKYIIQNKPTIKKEILEKLKLIISKESKRLFTVHSNLSIIGPSPFKSSNRGTTIRDCPCIVFFCIGKGFIPIGEPLFPNFLDGIEIDIREGFFTPFICDRCSIGQYRTLSSGSLGFCVSNARKPTVRGFITAAHVVVNKDVLCWDIQFQKQHVTNTNLIVVAPSDLDSQFPEAQRIYGNVSDMYFGQFVNTNKPVGIDAAFVQKQNGTHDDLNFHIPGNMSTSIISIDGGYLYRNVVKCGRTTSRTTGLIMYDGMDCKYEDSLNEVFVILENQYQIISDQDRTSFFKPGDSGSGVYIVQDGNYHPIGIAIASQNEDGEVCFVTPLKYILESLDLELYPASMETES